MQLLLLLSVLLFQILGLLLMTLLHLLLFLLVRILLRSPLILFLLLLLKFLVLLVLLFDQFLLLLLVLLLSSRIPRSGRGLRLVRLHVPRMGRSGIVVTGRRSIAFSRSSSSHPAE